MTRNILIGAGIGALAFWVVRRNATESAPAAAAPGIENEGTSIMGLLEEAAAWMGFRSVANLKRVDRAMLANSNVQAMLRVIREGESGQGDSAYRIIVGGGSFKSFADHPRIFGVKNSTAAGAYQITATTWDWIRPQMKLDDFSPSSQDFAALGLIAYRGALKSVLAGDLLGAIAKLRNEWTSLPGAAENKRVTIERARQLFVAYGGQLAGSVYA